ncbi:MAG: hypothetical protein ACLP36_04915 [Acidimicrobiales bacterium]
MEQQPGWPEYLDALEVYLQKVARLLGQRQLVVVPTLLVSQPSGPVPAEETERAAALLVETNRVAARVGNWIEEVVSSMRSIDARRRIEPGRPAGLIDSVL